MKPVLLVHVLISHLLFHGVLSQPCPPGVPVVQCFEDPCNVKTCKLYPDATCRANYCGGCNAEFIIDDMILTYEQCKGEDLAVYFPCPEDGVCLDGKWTRFFNVDSPQNNNGGDFETRPSLDNTHPGKICDRPSKVNVQLVNGDHYSKAGQIVHLSLISGFKCIDEEQTDNICKDYKIRFCCPNDQRPLGPQLSCTAWGDPHYETLDGLLYEFQGSCTYNFLSTIGTESYANVHPFAVWTQNDHRLGNTDISYVRKVHVRFSGQLITLDHSHNVEVNGEMIDLGTDYEDPFYGYHIHDNGMVLQFSSAFGLVIYFDGNHYLRVSIPVDYQRHVEGLCGNYNNDATDDLNPFGNAIDFAHSHAVEAGCEKPEPMPVCEGQNIDHAYFMCFNMITATCFVGCPSLTTFLTTCQKDYCALGGSQNALDLTLMDLHTHCSVVGGNPCDDPTSAWEEVFCPPNMILKRCGNACSATCEDPEPGECGPCIAACQCTGDLVLSPISTTCIPKEACTCTPGTIFRADDCEQLCSCSSEGEAFCFFDPCNPNELCIDSTCVPRTGCFLDIFGGFETECASPCPATCLDPYPDPCPTPTECQPGCECLEGDVLEDLGIFTVCTKLELCVSCTVREYQDGLMYYNHDCSSVCNCHGQQTCTDTNCDSSIATCTGGQCIPNDGYCDGIIGAFYSNCVDPCLPTCSNPNPTGPGCNDLCTGGCQCFPGLVLAEEINQCIAPTACGCYDEAEDIYYQLGQIKSFCTHICVCLPTGLNCSAGFPCEPLIGTCLGNECIPYPEECAHKPQSIYLECGTLCPETCIPSNVIFCPPVCVEGCFCPPNLILNNVTNVCVVRDGGCDGCRDEKGEPVEEKGLVFQKNCTEACFCIAGKLLCGSFDCSGICVDDFCEFGIPIPSSGSGATTVPDLIQLAAAGKQITPSDRRRLLENILIG